MAPKQTSKLHKKIFLILTIVVFAFLAYPVAADYLGPDRTVAYWTWERLDCHYFAYYDDPNPGYYGCHLDLYYPPDGSCPAANTTAPYFNPTACIGWVGTCGVGGVNCDITPSSSIVSCTNGQTGCRSTEHSTTYPPATISGGVTCTGSTVNGWCTGSAQLALSSNEPVAGYAITLMEGTRNGESFACPAGATSYNVPLLEGTNDFTFWALSSWGDSSLMSTATGSVDSQSPMLNGSLSGTGGDNGWYVSNVTFSASAADPTPGSGLSSFTYSLNGAAPLAFPGSLTLTDGTHTVDLQATDGAGHTVTLTRSASVDTVAPSSAFTYAPPASGWVRGSVNLTGTSSDATSGLAQVELSTDGGLTWQPLSGTSTWSSLWNTTTAVDGVHTLLARAQDVAGNLESTASLTLNVDNTPPQATLDAPAAFCPSCGTASLTYAVDDASSGLASWDLSVDGISLASGTASVMDSLTWDGGGLSLGSHTLALTVVDLAGNITDMTSSINLEAAPPVEPAAEKPSFFWFLAPKTPTPTPTATQVAPTPTATRTQVVESFAAVPPAAAVSPDPLFPDSELPASSILWGAAAAGVIAAATALALAEQRKRKLEEAAARAQAEQQNADARAREQGYGSYADMMEKQAKAAFDAAWNQMLADNADTPSLAAGEPGKAAGKFSNTASGKITTTTAAGGKGNSARATIPASSTASTKSLGTTVKVVKEEKPWYQVWWDTARSGAAALVQSVQTFVTQTLPTAYEQTKDKAAEWGRNAWTFLTQTLPQRAEALVESVFPAFQDEKVRQTGKAVGAIVGTGALLYGGYKVGLDIYCDYVLSKSTSWTPGLLMFVFPLSAVVMSREKRLRSGLLSLLIMGILLTGCTGGTTTDTATTPCPTSTPTPTQTPTQMPTYTITPDTSLRWTYLAGDEISVNDLETHYTNLYLYDGFIQYYNLRDQNQDYWQNEFINQALWDVANHFQLPPIMLKAFCMTESQCVLNPISYKDGVFFLNPGAGGIMQVSPAGGETIFRHISVNDPEIRSLYAALFQYANVNYLWYPLDDGTKFLDLSPEQQATLYQAVQNIYNGNCDSSEVAFGWCDSENSLREQDLEPNINLGALAIIATGNAVEDRIGQEMWDNLPDTAETQALVIAAGYKLGETGISQAAQQAKDLNNGNPPNWEQLAVQISLVDPKCSISYQQDEYGYYTPSDCSANYAEKMLCYAESISANSNVECTDPDNWAYDWSRP